MLRKDMFCEKFRGDFGGELFVIEVFAINCLLENVDAEKCGKLDKFSFNGFKFLGKLVEPETRLVII